MKTYLKTWAKKAFKSFGIDIHRIPFAPEPMLQLQKALNVFNIDMVFDVGANTGQFASKLFSAGFKGTVVSFEPLSDAHRSLSNNAKRNPRWLVHRRGAVGNSNGEIEINISGNSFSSSILPMTRLHEQAAIDSAYVSKEKAEIFKLDTIATSYFGKAKNLFLKIDTQGYEWEVLDGASHILPDLRGILCELSLVPLYDGQHLWLEIVRRLEDEGFILWALQRGFTDPRDGRSLQMDGIFFKK